MLFSSLEFIYLFLPATLISYFICPYKYRNLLLFFVSLAFYGFGEPLYLFLMLATIIFDYFFGLMIERSKKGRRVWLVLGIIFNFSLLAFFKYFDPLITAIGWKKIGIALPIGISFYIFQAVSYIIDVYRRSVNAEKNLVNFGAYVSLFPQLIAGPIVRYSDISEQLSKRSYSAERIAKGISVFIIGLAKKVLLANRSGELAERFMGENTLLSLWFGLSLFAFQIYYDFSGYSDMALGLGKILGFDFPENFNYPYTSTSITEFWRRWHITLSSFFREYLYLPLGGNRKGKIRTYINLFTVWSLTGLWHGASLNFIIWGLWFFLILVLEKGFLLKLLDRTPTVIRHIYAIIMILIGWQIFYMDGSGITEIFTTILKLFGIGVSSISSNVFLYSFIRLLPFFIILCIGATQLPKQLFLKTEKRSSSLFSILASSLSVIAIILCTAYIVDSGYDPFLYFRF